MQTACQTLHRDFSRWRLVGTSNYIFVIPVFALFFVVVAAAGLAYELRTQPLRHRCLLQKELSLLQVASLHPRHRQSGS
jgi:hypothetical protein